MLPTQTYGSHVFEVTITTVAATAAVTTISISILSLLHLFHTHTPLSYPCTTTKTTKLQPLLLLP